MDSGKFSWIRDLLPETNSLVSIPSRDHCVFFLQASTTSKPKLNPKKSMDPTKGRFSLGKGEKGLGERERGLGWVERGQSHHKGER